jgi:hypothetical protein
MDWAEHTEMTAVNGQDLRDIQAFGHRKNTRIDKIQISIVVFADNFSGT